MSSIAKTIVTDLEQEITDVNFGEPGLNELFKGLDKETKIKISKIPKKEHQIEVLKRMANPDLKEHYHHMNATAKKKLDVLPIRDKWYFIEQMHKKAKEENSNHEKSKKGVEVVVPEAETDAEPDEDVDADKHTVEMKQKAKVSQETGNAHIHKRIDKLLETYYSAKPFAYDSRVNHELEVKFGTKGKALTRNDYDNVIKKLKSSGFHVEGNVSGMYYLRIQCEFLDSITGRFKLSDIRTEIRDLHTIQSYCGNNNIKEIPPVFLDYIHKKPARNETERIFPVDVNDFNFRVSYQTEEKVAKGLQHFIVENWKKSKKEFRLLNRVTFVHPDYPFKVDVSITKFGTRGPDKFGRENRGPAIRVYTIQESNVFANQENYEIEIEIDNSKIGPHTKFHSAQLVASALRKVIKVVLGGLQKTNFPISYPEQSAILGSYMKMIWKDEYDPNKFIASKHFIGPNSITLQLKNIATIDENSNEPNVRKDFVVTDKADGERHLMYIAHDGKVYLINTNMDVIFTGAKTAQKDCFHSLLDGELIMHDKNGKFINLYAAFDVYYAKNQDIRSYTFMPKESSKTDDNDTFKCRYQILKWFEYNIKLVSILDTDKSVPVSVSGTEKTNKVKKSMEDFASPLRFKAKDFFPLHSKKQTIFDGCNSILEKEREGLFEYTTDGLIFTHSYYGVGATEVGKAGPKMKITWEHSFKWKPPQYNTIDFLVTTVKAPNGEDVVKSAFEDGTNNLIATQNNMYKTLELRCGFKESKDGFINPCQDIIEDRLPEYAPRYEDKQDNDYVPMRFYPTEPYDPNAGICYIPLRMDGAGSLNMFSEDNEVIEDNTIVEFRYDLDKESGWNWIPLRVRHDKTAKLRRGEKEYGNAYKVCNENWKSIHPTGRITEEMLCTGLNIPSISVSEDVYYNTPSGKFYTEALKQFHNLYVKRKLILGASKHGDTLIDFACGKAGDLPKWIHAKLSFVFGVDISSDNLENRLDGACARFLNMKKSNKTVPYALFVNGNSAFNIKDGSAMLNEKAKQITSAVFGNGRPESDKIGKGVARQYGKGADGFDIASCQFATHYFFQNPDTLKGFIKNIAECTKLNGYFIGTCYDGKMVFNELKRSKQNESIKIMQDGKKIWEITKLYSADTFEDNSSSIGYEISVYQESINQSISEYLVNFDYLNRVMSAYGFEIITREEAQDMGLPDGSGTFSELYMNMLDEIAKNRFKAKDYEQAPNMTAFEKKISFLNRYFVYKKIRTVNADHVKLDLGEYDETEVLRTKQETFHAQEVAKKETKKDAPKVRKLSKKMVLVPATEAVDETVPVPVPVPVPVQEPIPETKPKTKTAKAKTDAKPKPKKVKIVIEEE